MNAPAPRIAELHARANWRTIDFISDLHLQPAEAAAVSAWQGFMESTPADAVFLLGDVFEIWAGDDAVSHDGAAPDFEARCAQVMRAASARLDLFFMRGNRDFLVGAHFLAAAGAQDLHDPTVLIFEGRRWLLTHGDALCLDDTAYMAFRALVRDAQWQQAFLRRPLAERQSIARQVREQSAANKTTEGMQADIDPAAARGWLQAAQAATMIHGHTHKPRTHDLGDGLERVVLSDWDPHATPPRAEVLRLDHQGLRRLPLA